MGIRCASAKPVKREAGMGGALDWCPRADTAVWQAHGRSSVQILNDRRSPTSTTISGVAADGNRCGENQFPRIWTASGPERGGDCRSTFPVDGGGTLASARLGSESRRCGPKPRSAMGVLGIHARGRFNFKAIQRGNKFLLAALVEASWGASRKQGSVFQRRYRRWLNAAVLSGLERQTGRTSP
jgi:hypothetical protein